jgi:hypothetical protein
MRLTEQVDIQAVSVVGFGCKPRKSGKLSAPKRRKKAKGLVASDKTGKVALRLQAPLTRMMAELLGMESLLFEKERDLPRDGFKRIVLDVDFFSNVRVQIRNKEPDAVLDVIADRLERWIVSERKGVGPVIEWDVRTTGYVAQLADFVAIIENHAFVTTWSPAQGSLGFDTAPRDKSQTPEIYRVT